MHRLETDGRDDRSPPVLLARAQIEALRTASDADARYGAKWRRVRGLYDAGYDTDQVRELFRLIDWMMHLRGDLEARFKDEFQELEEARQMPYVTSVERLARAEGLATGRAEVRAEGQQRGAAAVVLKQITKRWGLLSAQRQDQLARLSLDQLNELVQTLLDLQTADELYGWLDAQAEDAG